jgi:hypothetical protein
VTARPSPASPARAGEARRAPGPRAARALSLLGPLLLGACAGYATPEGTVLWTPLGTVTTERADGTP